MPSHRDKDAKHKSSKKLKAAAPMTYYEDICNPRRNRSTDRCRDSHTARDTSDRLGGHTLVPDDRERERRRRTSTTERARTSSRSHHHGESGRTADHLTSGTLTNIPSHREPAQTPHRRHRRRRRRSSSRPSSGAPKVTVEEDDFWNTTSSDSSDDTTSPEDSSDEDVHVRRCHIHWPHVHVWT